MTTDSAHELAYLKRLEFFAGWLKDLPNLGNTNVVNDACGTVVETSDFYPYGKLVRA
jgi:hypothetical protein